MLIARQSFLLLIDVAPQLSALDELHEHHDLRRVLESLEQLQHEGGVGALVKVVALTHYVVGLVVGHHLRFVHVFQSENLSCECSVPFSHGRRSLCQWCG